MHRVLLWADASRNIGFGHFIRTLALAEILKDLYECIFFTQSPNDYQRDQVKNICPLVELPSDDSKFDVFLSYLTGNEIVILDNYFFTSSFEKCIKKKGCKLVSIGTNDRHYYADVVINYTDLRPSDFKAEPYTKFCIGLDWIILRSQFYMTSSNDKNGLIICIGGTDQFCYTEKFYDQIHRIFPNIKISVIISDQIANQRIFNFSAKNINVLLNLSAEQMAYALSSSQIALVSASNVAIEALSQHTQVISGFYVHNQCNIYNSLKTAGYIWGVGDFQDDECISRIISAIHDIQNGLKKRSFAALNTIDNYRILFNDLCK